MIDTHCHLDQPVFDGDREAVLARSRRAGVTQWVVPGIRLEDFPSVAALRRADLWIALGLHPLFCHTAHAVAQLDGWLTSVHPLAVGEIGLDYLAPASTHAAQGVLFEEQLRLARHHRLPVLLHVRKAHDAVLALLRRHGFEQGGIVHAFNGSLQQAHRYLDRAFCLGFGGGVTWGRARHLRRLAAALPEGALVLESDAPDLPPAGHRGERNEPCHVAYVAETLAPLRGTSVSHVAEVTRCNTRRVLRLEGTHLERIQGGGVLR